MSRDADLQRWLGTEGVFADDPQGPHLPDEQLASATLATLSDQDRAHLLSCAECRGVWRATLEFNAERHQISPQLDAPLPPPRRSPWLWVGALAACLGAFLILHRSEPATDPGFTAKGHSEGALEAPGFALRAVSTQGEVRDLPEGGVVQLSERIGFVYGNADGSAKRLVVLGYDGHAVHWYEPAGPGEPPTPLRAGPQSRGSRLPFDVALAAKHRAGPLKVVAAFDVDPQALAKQLAADHLPPGVTVLHIEVRP